MRAVIHFIPFWYLGARRVRSMSPIVVPDDIIHHILGYAEVVDVVRARLVCHHTPISLTEF